MSVRRALSLIPAVFLIACSSDRSNSPIASPVTLALQGSIHGGQQPVASSSVQLYAVGLAGGGTASTPLLSTPAISDANGGFNITGTYSCPTAASQVYILAQGGNPGLPAGTNNANLALMAALGPCGNLSASSYININEVTTVALANTLAPFEYSLAGIGSTPTDAILLNSAFTMANRFASTTTGASPGTNVPVGASVPSAKINTLANILSSCINSAGGVSGDGSPCGTLFALTTATGLAAATDTFTAAVRLADNPALNTAALFNTVPAAAPFQPMLSAAPSDFSVALTIPGLQASLNTVAFGSVAVGSAATQQAVTLSNNSSSAVAISSLALTGVYPGDFTENSNCPASLAPAATCAVQIGFTPVASGLRVAALVINNSGPAAPLLIGLSGWAWRRRPSPSAGYRWWCRCR